ncbi:glucose-6-phosphate exchanger SLC37A1 isoform X2 [Hydra vulgaris]|uniref:Glucose-6-phosphate exchanger SLC37A1 isoform X2 n=1 Tax=Hydra vulgaris TaxID=6087 RepID=A0ABM4DIP8_HYDVU
MTRLRNFQYLSFCVTWIAYASSYLLRKPLGVVKSDLQTSYNLSKTDLGWLDTCFLLPYALMQILLGNLGDKYSARLILSSCLAISSFSMVTFGYWNKMLVMGVLLFLNGSAQACLWPNCVKGLSNWYNDEQRATLFGVWGTCCFAGGIFGTVLAVHLQNTYTPDLSMVFAVPSVIVLIVAVLVYLSLRTPAEMNLVVEGKALPKHVGEPKEKLQLNLFQIWNIKMVAELSWTMFGMKLVRYCLYMWLPMYLNQNLKYSVSMAGMLSTAFDIGGVAGSALIGIFIDRVMGGRTYWGVVLALVSSAISLLAFQITSSWGLLFNFTLLFLVGAFSCGPDSTVSGTLACEAGERENAQSAVSGIINGFGSLGTVLEGPIVALIATSFGWNGTFYAMILLTLVGVIAMAKAAIMNDKVRRNTTNMI